MTRHSNSICWTGKGSAIEGGQLACHGHCRGVRSRKAAERQHAAATTNAERVTVCEIGNLHRGWLGK
jgi:hypothetical protein